MEKIKKNEKLRLIVQAISFAFHNGYVNGWIKGKIYTGDNKALCMPGLNCYSCPGAVGSCPIGSLQAVLDSGKFHFSCYVLGFIGLVGMLFGRFICGWICPFGLVQDLIHRIPIGRKRKNLPGHKYLRYLRFAVLILFVIVLPMTALNSVGKGQPWFCEYICPSGTLLGGIPLVTANADLRANIGFRFIWKIALLVLFLLGALIYTRPFCKYVCPLGALYGLCNPVSVYKLKIKKESCVECGACQKVCGMDIPVWKTPNSMDCIRCLKCKAACPTGSITSTFEEMKAKLRPVDSPAADNDNATIAVNSAAADSAVVDAAPMTANTATVCSAVADAATITCNAAAENDNDANGKTHVAASTPSTEATEASEASTGEMPANAKTSGLSRFLRFMTGAACILVSFCLIAFVIAAHYLYARTGVIEDAYRYILIFINHDTASFCALMQLVLGFRLIRHIKTRSMDKELCQWAKICVVVGAALCVVAATVVEAYLFYAFEVENIPVEFLAELRDRILLCLIQLVLPILVYIRFSIREKKSRK